MKLACASSLVALALAAAPNALADQFAWVTEDQARGAVEQLPPGALFGEWMSHMGGSPSLYLVREARVEPVGQGDYFQVVVEAEPFARSRRRPIVLPTPGKERRPRSMFEFGTPFAPDRQPVTKRVDLAYVYVVAPEGPSRMITLAEHLALRSEYFPAGPRVSFFDYRIPEGLAAEAAARRAQSEQAPATGQRQTTGLAGALRDADGAEEQAQPTEQADDGRAGRTGATEQPADVPDPATGDEADDPERGLPLPQGLR